MVLALKSLWKLCLYGRCLSDAQDCRGLRMNTEASEYEEAETEEQVEKWYTDFSLITVLLMKMRNFSEHKSNQKFSCDCYGK